VGQLSKPDKKLLVLTKSKLFVPPACKHYLAWGFSDFSLRFLSTEGEKREVVWDNVEVWGQIKQVHISEDGKHVITAGTDTTISVFRLAKKDGSMALNLVKRLHAHTRPITALLVSRAHSIIISSSEQGDCVVWDLNKLSYIRTIGPMDSAVSAIAVHEINGDIVVCAGTSIAVWTINGRLLYSGQSPSPITVVTLSQSCEWSEAHRIFITGHQDGTITVWKVGQDKHDLTRFVSFALENSAAITALLLTRDDKVLYSGDMNGAVTAWADEEHHEMEHLHVRPGAFQRLHLPSQPTLDSKSSHLSSDEPNSESTVLQEDEAKPERPCGRSGLSRPRSDLDEETKSRRRYSLVSLVNSLGRAQASFTDTDAVSSAQSSPILSRQQTNCN